MHRDPCSRRPTAGRRLLPAVLPLATALAACAPSQVITVDPRYLTNAMPGAYDDAEYAAVLRNHVERGLVRYASLAQDRAPLERFVATLGAYGPRSTPQAFPTPADRVCYYINAYNACALRAVLEAYPTTTVHTLELPFEYGNRFRVDGRQVTLGRLRELTIAESDGDVRVLFCLSAAAVGSPRLAGQPYRPASLDDQVRAAVDDGLDNPGLVRIDDHQGVVYLWGQVVNRRQDFTALHIRGRGRGSDSLVTVLAALSSGETQARLRAAADYRIQRMPFDRRLNDVPLPRVAAATAPATAP